MVLVLSIWFLDCSIFLNHILIFNWTIYRFPADQILVLLQEDMYRSAFFPFYCWTV